jgi:alkanesulfonate monooxygenase SsuD/methylene tetrahydromethanopterin reductase-like flavin-dependent oxidoreductase (luciferase family)
MADIRVGYVEPLLRPTTADGLRRAVALAEDGGIDHLGVCDHVSFHSGIGFDALVRAASILAASEHLEVNTGVYLLPLRHPVLVARQLADLATFAPGRLTFGVGIGGEDPHEVQICGVDPRTRGRRMDECMLIVRRLLAGDAVDHDSEFFQLDGVQIGPTPAVQVPMVVGGRSPAAFRRAGRLGDGWIGVFVSPERYRSSVEQVAREALAAERPPGTGHNGLNIWMGVGRDEATARDQVAPEMEAFYRIPFGRFAKYAPCGTPSQLADALVPYAEAGCSIFNLMIVGRDPEEEVAAVAEIRSHLLARAG